MMTTLAAMFGAVPLAIGMGAGSELRQPLGIAIVGGLHPLPGADPVHHPGRLSLLRAPARPVPRLAPCRRAAARCTRVPTGFAHLSKLVG